MSSKRLKDLQKSFKKLKNKAENRLPMKTRGTGRRRGFYVRKDRHSLPTLEP